MTTRRFSSFAEIQRQFGEVDEILFTGRSGLAEETIVELCREARRRARHLREHYGARSVAEIAECHGVRIIRDEWEVAGGRLVYFAECLLDPPQIRLNRKTICQAAANAAFWIGPEQSGAEEQNRRRWLTEAAIEEATIAHEMFHLLAPRTPPPEAEWSAHAFARTLCAMPFSPLLYQELCAHGGTVTSIPDPGQTLKPEAN